MMNRIATSSGARTMMHNIHGANRALLTAQEQATSGRRINKMSDDPASASSALNHREALRRNTQFARNADEARSWLESGDAALSDVSDRLASVRTLLIQANSGSGDATSRAAIAAEIRSIRDSIVQVANTTRDGRPLFAGTSGAAVAYDSAGVYQGDAGTVSIPVTAGVSVQVNRTGPDVFGTTNADPLQGDVFQQLEALATSVAAGDTAAISAGITTVDVASKRVAGAQVVLGTRASQVDDITNSLADQKVSLSSRLSDVEDIDLAEAILNLKSRETAYQAALQATAKVIQPTLLDFLR